MAPRYSDPGKTWRSRHTRLPKSDTMARGNHRLRRTAKVDDCKLAPRFRINLKKTGLNRHGGVLSKKMGKKRVEFFLVLLPLYVIDKVIDC